MALLGLKMMMCDTVNRSFRAQLAAILEKLTKAAVLEISGLADECSAVLHSEISQQKTENEALRKRCYSLEVQLRAAREAHGFCSNRPQPAGEEETELHPFIQSVFLDPLTVSIIINGRFHSAYVQVSQWLDSSSSCRTWSSD